MIFENLLVNNFGVYSGKQNFDLTTDKKKPVILIGAMNGSGKTTFLQAIDFVLYGKFSIFFNLKNYLMKIFLKKNINKETLTKGTNRIGFLENLKEKIKNLNYQETGKQWK